MSASIVIARHLGVSQELVQEGIETFLPLPHRLEVIHNREGQIVINDSKSTTVAATVAAVNTVLERFPSSRVALMIGGLSKAGSWAPLFSRIADVGVSLVCFGEDRTLLASHCRAAGIAHIVARNLHEATTHAVSMTVGGGVALLSPGCASFDEFRDFEERGAAFRVLVQECFRQEERTSL
jgi:UDP-N-acetylmuramoylalanine--D-glutamate ligase